MLGLDNRSWQVYYHAVLECLFLKSNIFGLLIWQVFYVLSCVLNFLRLPWSPSMRRTQGVVFLLVWKRKLLSHSLPETRLTWQKKCFFTHEYLQIVHLCLVIWMQLQFLWNKKDQTPRICFWQGSKLSRRCF